MEYAGPAANTNLIEPLSQEDCSILWERAWSLFGGCRIVRDWCTIYP